MKGKAIVITVVGILFALLIGFYLFMPSIFDQQKTAASDAVDTEKLVGAGDGYLGYALIKSPKMKLYAPMNGLEVEFDTKNYPDWSDRFKALKSGDLDFAVMPINEAIRHGKKYNYPGSMVAGLCESQGADAILAFNDLSTGAINDINNSRTKITVTPMSPSEFLVNMAVQQFGLDVLKNSDSWKIDANDSEDVYEKAKEDKSNGKTKDKYYVMWEPEVTKAVNKLGMKVVWSSEKFKGMIIDVVVFSDKVINDKPELVEKFLKTYFRVVDSYASDVDVMVEDIAATSDLDEDDIRNLLNKIDFFSFSENCTRLFGIPLTQGGKADDWLYNSIVRCADIMHRSKTFDQSDFTNAYKLVNSTFLSKMSGSMSQSIAGIEITKEINFKKLSDSEWEKLNQVGSLALEDIQFLSGASDFRSEEDKETVDSFAEMLIQNYPTARCEIGGHTRNVGDANANKKLSQERAEVVMQRLLMHGIQENRLRAKGYGGSVKLRKQSDWNPREYMRKEMRVEFKLLENNSI